MTSFKEKLILSTLEDLIPDIETPNPKKIESVKIKQIFDELMNFVNMGNMRVIIIKITNIIIFSIEKSSDEEEKARLLLTKLKIILEK